MAKSDKFGIVAGVCMGVLTAMVYKAGKLKGQYDAYTHCADILQKTIDEAEKKTNS